MLKRCVLVEVHFLSAKFEDFRRQIIGRGALNAPKSQEQRLVHRSLGLVGQAALVCAHSQKAMWKREVGENANVKGALLSEAIG